MQKKKKEISNASLFLHTIPTVMQPLFTLLSYARLDSFVFSLPYLSIKLLAKLLIQIHNYNTINYTYNYYDNNSSSSSSKNMTIDKQLKSSKQNTNLWIFSHSLRRFRTNEWYGMDEWLKRKLLTAWRFGSKVFKVNQQARILNFCWFDSDFSIGKSQNSNLRVMSCGFCTD